MRGEEEAVGAVEPLVGGFTQAPGLDVAGDEQVRPGDAGQAAGRSRSGRRGSGTGSGRGGPSPAGRGPRRRGPGRSRGGRRRPELSGRDRRAARRASPRRRRWREERGRGLFGSSVRPRAGGAGRGGMWQPAPVDGEPPAVAGPATLADRMIEDAAGMGDAGAGAGEDEVARGDCRGWSRQSFSWAPKYSRRLFHGDGSCRGGCTSNAPAERAVILA